jgi:hypothetical protein
MSDAPVIVRFQHSTAVMIGVLLVVIPGAGLCMMVMPSILLLLPALGIPILTAVWTWRPRTDASLDGLVIRAPLGVRSIPWSDVSDLFHDANGRVGAHVTSGGTVELPAVRIRDLPLLRAVAQGSTTPPRAGSTVSLEDRRIRRVNRNDWRFAAVLVSLYLALGLAAGSVQVHRPVSTQMVADTPTVRQLPAGGWPFSFVYDSPCCSVIGTLGPEDEFKPGWFLLDAAVFGALPALVVGAVILRRRTGTW